MPAPSRCLHHNLESASTSSVPNELTVHSRSGLRFFGLVWSKCWLFCSWRPVHPPCATAETTNLVANGSFELAQLNPALPDYWSAPGRPKVKERISLDVGRDGKRCARLEGLDLSPAAPHPMLYQTHTVSVVKGHWYRLTFWAQAQGIKSGLVECALADTKGWKATGLGENFPAPSQWQPFEFRFCAQEDVPAANSRLQFWFKSTGTLWVDDVVLADCPEGQQYFPQIATEGVKNFVPNSSFECGTANWGSLSPASRGWQGNLYRLEGELDAGAAAHGQHSFKLELSPGTLPVSSFDSYRPSRHQIRSVLLANQGWFRVKPGETLTLSAFLQAEREGLPVQFVVTEPSRRGPSKTVKIGTKWERHQFTFAPEAAFLFVAIGVDLSKGRESATLWLDGIQLERGDHATEYEPRLTVESFVETSVPGNTFTNPVQGAAFTLRAFNNSAVRQLAKGRFSLTDFFDREVFVASPFLKLAPHSTGILALNNLLPGKRGFFRADWRSGDSQLAAAASLRCAIIDPLAEDATDSPFGFNHAYPWDFLVRQARQAGILWWRDWSAQWQVVESQQGKFDFTHSDEQINRVRALNCEVEVLLPYPSTEWSTSATPETMARATNTSHYSREQVKLSFAPKDWNDFARYAAEVVTHYSRSSPRPVTIYQLLNEPINTLYSLSHQVGYTVDDYVRCVETASRAMKAANPRCLVVGGISDTVDAKLTLEFVKKGGLRFVDIMDMHMYEPRTAETYEELYAALTELMRAHGGPKPLWITEWGCYADDDPQVRPLFMNEWSMDHARWPSERAATEHIVKFAAVSFAHGVRKIFFHAGSCGTINGLDAASVIFEYGGTPRKMYSGVSAFTRLLGVPESFVQQIEDGGLKAFIFRARNHVVAIAWSASSQGKKLKLPRSVQAYDIMGNALERRGASVGDSPVYLVGIKTDDVIRSLTP